MFLVLHKPSKSMHSHLDYINKTSVVIALHFIDFSKTKSSDR